MWIANGWKEYEVIDTSCGEKLERWGKYLLVRPDPQVIWDTPKTEPGWRKMNAHYCLLYTSSSGKCTIMVRWCSSKRSSNSPIT